jgi:chloramphenicol 3-O-phosphotransferase
VFAVVITGAPGAGKSHCLMLLSDALVDDEIAHAGIDSDEVAWAYPFPDLARRTELIAAAWEAHRRSGHELVLVAEVIESDEHLRELLAALGAEDHLLVGLEASPATLRERIMAREPPGWSGLQHLLDEMERYATSIGELGGIALTVDTEETPPEEVAGRIRAERPDVLGG